MANTNSIEQIGIVIVTHGKLAYELVKAAEHVVGEQENFRFIAIEPEDNVDQRRDQIRQTVKACDSGMGVIILTDMFGGTPSNLALDTMSLNNIDVIGGVNLPMLIHLLQIRSEQSLKEAVESTCEAGRKYIRVGSHILSPTK